MQSHPRTIQESTGKSARLLAGLVLLMSMASPSQAASSLPGLTIPDGFGVNIHFTGNPQYLLLAD
jgi:hypothetical protein